MKMTVRFILAVLAMAVLSAWGVRRSHAWGAHTVLSNAFGAGAAGLASDIPDTWGESHFGRKYLAGKVRFWTAKAKPLSFTDPNKAIYTGYALHYLEDAGQPWHIYTGSNTIDGVGDGPDTPHIKFEVYVAKRYPLYAVAIAKGARSPVSITSARDAYNKTIKLAEAVNDFYPRLDAEDKWDANSKDIKEALRLTAGYGKGLVDYILAPSKSVKDKPCRPGQQPCKPAANQSVPGDALTPATGGHASDGINSLRNTEPAANQSAPPEPAEEPEEP